MANVTNILLEVVKAPSGLWPTILNWIEHTVVNYGWVIILFTLLIKVCLSPMDLLIKFTTKKTTLVQQKLSPQLARLNKKYAEDKQQLQMQTQALYKKEGYNVFGSCIVTLINLVVTMVVFFTLFASLRQMSAYKAINQYAQMEQAYVQTLESETKQNFISKVNGYLDGSGKTYESEYKVMFEGDPSNELEKGYFYHFFSNEGLSDESKNLLSSTVIYTNPESAESVSLLDTLTSSTIEAQEKANQSAANKWEEVKDNWLWIKNIWVSDNYKSPIPTYNDLKSLANSSKIASYKTYVNNINPTLYKTVTKAVETKNDGWNGYFILAILSAVLTFLSQWITERMSKSKNKNINNFVDNANPQANSMKIMKFILPILMVIFVLTSSAAFALYIVASSIVSIIISVITSLIVNACYKKKEEEIIASLEREALRSLKKNKR